MSWKQSTPSIIDRLDAVKKSLPAWPGFLASLLMITATTFWTFWGIAEMYHEGWWGAWTNRLPYLAPIVLTLVPTLVAFRWPMAGGSLIILIGGFALFFFDNDVAFIGLAIALVGVVFLWEGIQSRRDPSTETSAPSHWWPRHWRYILAIGLPGLVIVTVSAVRLPVVLTRMDDGVRSARLIDGNQVTLVWAPEGPGWNWQQPWGGYSSWQRIALYGVSPVGLDDKPGYGQGAGETVFASGEEMTQYNLCLYLDSTGTTLLNEPQNIWRMPTTEELVRSLGRHGENAGCAWQGEFRTRVQCGTEPDKESPLWATDHPAIYYWTADSYNDSQGYFVAFNGTVSAAYKLGGNPRHSYRCVREP
jgi:hypothetical protein